MADAAKARRELERGTRREHECVVFLARSVDDPCRMGRLASLLASAGRARDVWLLHNNTTEAQLATLRRQYPQLLVAQQPAVPPGAWRLFGGKLINYTKAAFLLWLLADGPQARCAHAWQIEDDVFFTGRWRELFDAHAHASPRADIVATVSNSSADKWVWGSTCALNNNTRCPQVEGQMANVFWPSMRISRRLAREVSRALGSGARGFHEALLMPVCTASSWGCEVAPLADGHIGLLATGHSPGVPRAKSQQSLEWATSSGLVARGGAGSAAGRLYHPVKCEADAMLGAKAQQWAAVRPPFLGVPPSTPVHPPSGQTPRE